MRSRLLSNSAWRTTANGASASETTIAELSSRPAAVQGSLKLRCTVVQTNPHPPFARNGLESADGASVSRCLDCGSHHQYRWLDGECGDRVADDEPRSVAVNGFAGERSDEFTAIPICTA